MPKKQAKNAFWFFMTDWRRLQENKGRSFPNGYRDIQADPECNDAWRALTPAEKVPYTVKAKKAKSEPGLGKLTGTGESIQMIKDEEQRNQDFGLNMEAHIRHTIANAKKYKSLPSLTFPFIHMNFYYMRVPDTEPVDYCPAEFAIGEFSLEFGLSKYYHEIIRTDLHLGYTREAMETSEKTHKLHWNLPIGEGDWGKIYHKMMIFLEPLMINGELPPIYTLKKHMHILPSLLRRMTNAVGHSPEKFTIYSLESLFGCMLRAVTDHPESNVVSILAETQLSKELFAYTPNIECEYHQGQEGTSQFCSLSVIRQWAFEFCDQCCKLLGIEMRPGIHFPDTTEMAATNRTLNSSFYSLVSDRSVSGRSVSGRSVSGRSVSGRSVSVLSATGVSEQHRIAVSERSRDEDARRRMGVSTVEIIDHSLLSKEERKPIPEDESPIAVAVPAAVPPAAPSAWGTSSRTPSTASQALIGVSRVAPIFNGENFPAIGGRGAPIKKADNRRPEGPIWSHRGRKNSDSD